MQENSNPEAAETQRLMKMGSWLSQEERYLASVYNSIHNDFNESLSYSGACSEVTAPQENTMVTNSGRIGELMFGSLFEIEVQRCCVCC